MTRISENAAKSGLPGEGLPGVIAVHEFLDKAPGNPRYRLKGETLVIGGDDAAFEAAQVAQRCGSEKVTVVCLERADEMAASPEAIAQAEDSGVRVIHGWGPTRLAGHSDGRVSGAYFKHCERVRDDAGRFAPVYDEDNVMAQYADNVILAIR